jgi:arylsulfatase A-like enzyme
VGGGKPGTGLWGKDPGRKLYDVDAAFEDQEHEWYDLQEDPHEMHNLAHDQGRRAELRANYERLLEYEAAEFTQPKIEPA